MRSFSSTETKKKHTNQKTSYGCATKILGFTVGFPYFFPLKELAFYTLTTPMWCGISCRLGWRKPQKRASRIFVEGWGVLRCFFVGKMVGFRMLQHDIFQKEISSLLIFCLSRQDILEYISFVFAFDSFIYIYKKVNQLEKRLLFLVYLYIGNYLEPLHEISCACFHSSGAWPTEPTTLTDPCVDGASPASPITTWNILPATPRQREWVTCRKGVQATTDLASPRFYRYNL